MQRVPWNLVAGGVAVAALVAVSRDAVRGIGCLAIPLLPLVGFAVLLALDLLGRGDRRATRLAAVVLAVPTVLVGLLVPVALPCGLLLAASALASGPSRGSEVLPETLALRSALARFGRRREALGAHYRWRLALWLAPHASLAVLTTGLGLGLGLTTGLAPMLPEVVLRGLGEPGALLQMAGLFVLVTVGAVGGALGSFAVTPLSRAPVVGLLRASWPDSVRRAGVGVLVPAVLLLCDLLLLATIIGLVLATVATIVAPGVAGGAAVVPVVVAGVVLVLRLTLADVALLTGEGLVAASKIALRLVMGHPAAATRVAVAWVLGISGIAAGCVAATAGVAFTFWPIVTARLDGATAQLAFVAVVLAAFGGTVYVAAPPILLLKLFRVALVDVLLSPAPPPPDPSEAR